MEENKLDKKDEIKKENGLEFEDNKSQNEISSEDLFTIISNINIKLEEAGKNINKFFNVITEKVSENIDFNKLEEFINFMDYVEKLELTDEEMETKELSEVYKDYEEFKLNNDESEEKIIK